MNTLRTREKGEQTLERRPCSFYFYFSHCPTCGETELKNKAFSKPVKGLKKCSSDREGRIGKPDRSFNATSLIPPIVPPNLIFGREFLPILHRSTFTSYSSTSMKVKLYPSVTASERERRSIRPSAHLCSPQNGKEEERKRPQLPRLGPYLTRYP